MHTLRELCMRILVHKRRIKALPRSKEGSSLEGYFVLYTEGAVYAPCCCKQEEDQSIAKELNIDKEGKVSVEYPRRTSDFKGVKLGISAMLIVGTWCGKFKESLKSLEADIQYANTLALEFPRDYDGACLQMRLSYSPAAHFFLFFVCWTDCSLAGALGLLRILIYKVYKDGTTTMSTYERKSSLREFYAYILPSLQQLQGGLTMIEELKQKVICMERYKKKFDDERGNMSDLDLEWEQECGICMENNTKIVLPDCNHAMCLDCFRDWHARSQSCPFCRDSLKRVESKDVWVYTELCEVQDTHTLTKDSLRRLFMYIDKLPLLVSQSVFAVYDSHLK